MVNSLLALQHASSGSQALKSELEKAQNRILSISQTHELLYKDDELFKVEGEKYFESISRSAMGIENSIQLEVKYTLELSMQQAVYCGLIVNELVTNTIKYAFENRNRMILIEMFKDAHNVVLQVSDNGRGYDPKNVLDGSLGLHLVNKLVTRQLEGTINIYQKEGMPYEIRFMYEEI